MRPLPGRSSIAGDERLVHQVVRKDTRTIRAHLRDSLPESRLRSPALFLGEIPVPRRHIGDAVRSQASNVQVHPDVLGKANQLVEARETSLIRRSGRVHESGDLQLEADHVGAKTLHLAKIPLDLRPSVRLIAVPVVLEQAESLVADVVEAPRDERRAVARASETVSSDIHGYPGGRLAEGRHAESGEKEN